MHLLLPQKKKATNSSLNINFCDGWMMHHQVTASTNKARSTATLNKLV
jgi:hypothetical protein